MSTDAEIVAKIQAELYKFASEHVIGQMIVNHRTLTTVIDECTARMQERLPDYKFTAINPRIEGDSIVWDGWLMEPRGPN